MATVLLLDSARRYDRAVKRSPGYIYSTRYKRELFNLTLKGTCSGFTLDTQARIMARDDTNRD